MKICFYEERHFLLSAFFILIILNYHRKYVLETKQKLNANVESKLINLTGFKLILV